MDTHFAMAASPGTKSIEIHLKPREWMLLCYLHGGRSVKDLVELTGYTDFETARILYGMYAVGLIEKVDSGGEPVSD
jgi:DNA-binding MarR family transcriptional regulator